MIVAILVVGLVGFGIHDAYKEEQRASRAVKFVCEGEKCSGFSPLQGFAKQETQEDEFVEDYFEEFVDNEQKADEKKSKEKAREYFSERAKKKNASRSPALIKRGKIK